MYRMNVTGRQEYLGSSKRKLGMETALQNYDTIELTARCALIFKEQILERRMKIEAL